MSDPGSRRGPDVPLQACRALNYFLQVRQGVKSRDRAAWRIVVPLYAGSYAVHLAYEPLRNRQHSSTVVVLG